MKSIYPLRCVACLMGVLSGALAAHADDWPQWRGLHRDGVWAEKGILEKFPADGLKIRWRVPLSAGYSSPVVAQGRVFVTDRMLGAKEKLQATERVHCLEEATGKLLWKYAHDTEYPDFAWPPNDDFGGPVSTPIVQDGKLYAIGGVGNLYCLDTAKGQALWTRDLVKDYGIGRDFCRTGSPLIEGNLLIVQTAGIKPRVGIAAFDRNTGKEMWHALDAHGYFNSPLVVSAGGKRQLIAVTDSEVTSLDPATGKTYWRERFVVGRNIPTPVWSRNRLLVNGLMFALHTDKPSATVLWPERKPDAYLSDTTSPLVVGDLVISHKRPDGLACLDAGTGKLLWETDRIKSSMHSLTRCGDGFFIFTDNGTLIRARVSAQRYEEVSRTALIKPTTKDGKSLLAYSAPSYANGHVFARNDEELICASLTAEP